MQSLVFENDWKEKGSMKSTLQWLHGYVAHIFWKERHIGNALPHWALARITHHCCSVAIKQKCEKRHYRSSFILHHLLRCCVACMVPNRGGKTNMKQWTDKGFHAWGSVQGHFWDNLRATSLAILGITEQKTKIFMWVVTGFSGFWYPPRLFCK